MAAPSPTPAATLAEDTDLLGRVRGLLEGNLQDVGLAVIFAAAVAVVLLAAVVLILSFGRRRRRKGAVASPPPAGARAGAPGGRRTMPLMAPPPEPCLELAQGDGQARTIPLSPAGLTIGRAEDNDLVIAESVPGWESVSQHHARISLERGRWMLEDLGSQNGVFVNGRRTGRNLLQDGWTLAIGGVRVTFHAGSGEAAR